MAADAAAEPDLLETKGLFNEWLLCKRCGLQVIVCQTWRLKICNQSYQDFFAGMFLLGTAKYCVLPICNNHLNLLASKLCFVDAPLSTLHSRLDKL